MKQKTPTMGNGAYKYNTRCEFKIKRTNTLNKLHIRKKAIFVRHVTDLDKARLGPEVTVPS